MYIWLRMEKQTCIRLLADPEQIQSCKASLREGEGTFGKLSEVYSLVGNEVRLKILFLLKREKELCPCDLSDILEMTIPAVSQHLKKLKEAKMVETRKKGQTIYYFLSDEGGAVLKSIFQQFDSLTQQLEKV